jgi:hypothetical protein
MGLAVYLEDAEEMTVQSECHACGQVKTEQMRKEYFYGKITHNLTAMAAHCGLYEALWRPEEHGFVKALQLIPVLKEGLEKLRTSKETCLLLSPENGWGTYGHLVSFTGLYLEACEKYPESIIRAEP